MTEEADRRIEAARQDAERQKQTAEFLESLKPGDEAVRQIVNPEAFVLRSQASARASRNELPRTACTHPLDHLQQYVDDDPLRKREGRMVNLFGCGICHLPIWLVDPWGNAVADG